jgi:uncharacterized protein HemX
MKPTDENALNVAHAAGPGPVNPTVTFEPDEVDTAGIQKTGVILALTVLLSLAVCAGVFYLLSRQQTEGTSQVSPLVRAEQSQTPPAPQMQGIPGDAIPSPEQQKQFQKAAQERLDSFGWVDQQRGVAHIPISDAMRIIAEKGLPPLPLAIAAPPKGPKTK